MYRFLWLRCKTAYSLTTRKTLRKDLEQGKELMELLKAVAHQIKVFFKKTMILMMDTIGLHLVLILQSWLSSQ